MPSWRETLLRLLFPRLITSLEERATVRARDDATFEMQMKLKNDTKVLRKEVSRLHAKNKQLTDTVARHRSLGKAPPRIKQQVLKAANYRCHYCGNWAETVDHVIPRGRGGSDGKHNLVACCEPCNLEKADMTGIEYFDYLETKRLFGTNGGE